jgi:tetratricopeptide (TPR) repeat protein
MTRFPIFLSCLVVLLGGWTFQSAPQRMQEAMALLGSGNREDAETILSTIVQEYPRYGPARLQLGRLALESDRLEEAQEHLEIATSTNLRRPFLAWHLLGRVYVAQGDYQQARECFQKALAGSPDFAPARLFLAEVSERQGDQWEALAGYRKVLDGSPEGPERVELQGRIANLARAMGAYDLAECYVGKALEAQPDNGYFHYLLAVILSEADRVDEALPSCRRAIELGFREAAVYFTLGNLLHEKMLLSESIAALGKAVELDPNAAEAIAAFALSSLTTEDSVALRALLEEHVQAHPDNVNTLYSLGAMHVRENKLEEARAYFERLKTLAPRHAQVHYNLGLIYLQQGKQAEGRSEMARFRRLKAEEDEEWLKHNRAYRRRLAAEEAVSAGEPEKAIELYRSLVSEGTAEVPDLVELGGVHMSVEQYADAYSWFDNALRLSPYDRDALSGMAGASEALAKEDVVARCRARLELLTSPCEEDE